VLHHPLDGAGSGTEFVVVSLKLAVWGAVRFASVEGGKFCLDKDAAKVVRFLSGMHDIPLLCKTVTMRNNV
jgi:hypothetical protein